MTDRRSLIKKLAGATLLVVARRASAQKMKSFTITYLALLPGEDRSFVPFFLRRLDQLGYVDGQNLLSLPQISSAWPERPNRAMNAGCSRFSICSGGSSWTSFGRGVRSRER